MLFADIKSCIANVHFQRIDAVLAIIANIDKPIFNIS